MSTAKKYKISKIVSEVSKNSTGRYSLAGVDQGLAKYLYRKPQEQFVDLARGDYTIDSSGGTPYLVIQNPTIISEMEALQIVYTFEFTATEYKTDFNVDINILKDRYNTLVKNTETLWEYVRKLGFSSDSASWDIILPELDTDEVWVKTSDGWRGLNIGNLEANIQALIDEFKRLVTESFNQFEAKKDEYLAELESVKNGQEAILDNYLNQNLNRVKAEGDLQVSRVTLAGTENSNKVINTGNFQYQRLSELIAMTGIDTKLILINQMFDVIIGSNRYLNGVSLELRDILYLDRTADGGSLSTRQNLRSSYDGGLLSNRTVTIPNVPGGISHPITIDLGGV